MDNLSYNNALDLIDETLGIKSEKKINLIKYGICEDCDGYLIEQQTCVWYCPNCCTITNEFIVSNDSIKKRNNYYYRRLYFVEKLNLIAGIKIDKTNEYKNVLNTIKQYEFKNIKELRKLMKRLRLNKYYRQIYNIYYDIKNVRIINITSQDISKMSAEFVRMEEMFKLNKELHHRCNMFPYSSMIYFILKRNNILGYNKLLLPCEQNKVIKTINKYCLIKHEQSI